MDRVYDLLEKLEQEREAAKDKEQQTQQSQVKVEPGLSQATVTAKEEPGEPTQPRQKKQRRSLLDRYVCGLCRAYYLVVFFLQCTIHFKEVTFINPSQDAGGGD